MKRSGRRCWRVCTASVDPRPTPSCESSSRRNWTTILPPGCCKTRGICHGWLRSISVSSMAARLTPTINSRVQVSAGRITAFLRDDWGLNAILADGDEDEKNRADHRHHAVDAVVIALTDNTTVAMLSRSAEVAAERGHRLFALDEIKKPWPTFHDDVRRVDRRDQYLLSRQPPRQRSAARGDQLQQAAQFP